MTSQLLTLGVALVLGIPSATVPSATVPSATVPSATVPSATVPSATVPSAVPAARAARPTPAAPTGSATGLPRVNYTSPSGQPPIVVRAFEISAGPYGPGHRGVDLDLSSKLDVRAAAQGAVTYVGRIAGRGVIVVLHPDGLRTEYEPVASSLRRGQQVVAGQILGRIGGTHPGCAVPHCLHWSARRGTQYLDPMTLLAGPLGPVRLLPLSDPVPLLPRATAQARGWARR